MENNGNNDKDKIYSKNEYQNPFNDDFLNNLNNEYGNLNMNSNDNDDDFLSNLNSELNMQNYFQENQKNNENTSMFSNSKFNIT